MKKLNVFAIIVVLALAVMTFGVVHAADKLNTGFIYVGPIGDLGYTYQHEVGRRALRRRWMTNQHLSGERAGRRGRRRAIQQLARAGNN